MDRRPKLRPKAEAFFPSASASVAEAFWQKVGQKVSYKKMKHFHFFFKILINPFLYEIIQFIFEVF